MRHDNKPFFTLDQTSRGFTVMEFDDHYGAACSLQESSLGSEKAIWLGPTSADPKILATDAKRLGLNPAETAGWVPYAVPPEVMMATRMHLTQQNVADMLPTLQHFATTGNLPNAPIPPVAPWPDALQYSVDGGKNYQQAPQGLHLIYDNVPVVVDGEDGHGQLRIHHDSEGMMVHVYGSRDGTLTQMGSNTLDVDDLIELVIDVDTTDA